MKARLNTALLEPYLARWRELAPRERVLVATGLGATAVLVFVMLLWVPMQRDLSRLRETVPQERAKLMLMRAQAAKVNQLRASGAVAATGANVLATLEQTANARGLRQAITRMEPEGSNGARLTLDGVAFNALVSWLNDLQAQNGIRVENATVEGRPSPGVVNARITLRGPAS